MTQPLYIAFVWHMHQPYYRDLATGACHMPWVRLHGTKDYLDMVKLLEPFPNVHQTFNLVPSLLEQIDEYLPPANQSDQFLDLSRKPAAELTDLEKRFLLEHFFMANWDHLVKPYPRYHDLLAKRGPMPADEQAWTEALRRFKAQDYLDLQVWFNLTWIDPWLRRQDRDLAGLEAKGGQFTESDKRLVLNAQLRILQQIIPAYRQAQERGQVELTTAPYYHPILPLVCDLHSARQAIPKLPLPETGFRYPEDARWQVAKALERHAERFGRKPAGLWPSEGSVSEEVARLVIEQGIRWIATDEEILWRTLRTGRSAELLYRPHLIRRDHGQTAIIFRDHELSDLIGFVYSRWHPAVAVQDFVQRLAGIHQRLASSPVPGLVSIILDGENAWEFYPGDAYEFLSGLYTALAKDERFRLVTVSEYLDRHPIDQTPSLPELCAGSWIDGNFTTWIGHPEKNAAWSHLARVREDLIAAAAPSPEAWRSFYVAEGSDWMWWLGDTHSSAQDQEFDRLFRMHLKNVYRFLGQEAPAWLEEPIKVQTVQPAHEPTAWMTPTIDGRETAYYEWLYAGSFDLRKGYAAIHRGTQLLQTIWYGFDKSHCYLRIDVDRERFGRLEGWQLRMELPGCRAQIGIERAGNNGVVAQFEAQETQPLACAYDRVIELAIPMALLAVKPGEAFQLRLALSRGEELLEQYPPQGGFRISVPADDFEARMWFV